MKDSKYYGIVIRPIAGMSTKVAANRAAWFLYGYRASGQPIGLRWNEDIIDITNLRSTADIASAIDAQHKHGSRQFACDANATHALSTVSLPHGRLRAMFAGLALD